MFGDARGRMLAIDHAGGRQHGPRDELAAVGEGQALVPGVDRDARHLEGRQELGAEPLRLHQGAPRQLVAADSRRKPEIVFDLRARSCLSTWCVPIEQ
jgi:hypothetical protein